MTDKTQAEKAALKAGFTAIEWGDGWWRTEHIDPHGWASGESVEELMGFISGWRAAQEAVSSKDEAREGAPATFQATSDTPVGPVEISVTCSSDGDAIVEGVMADGTKVPVKFECEPSCIRYLDGGEGDYEPKWRSTPILDLKASKDRPEVFHGYSETEGGRVEISIQVASDGTGTGTMVLPSGKEVPMKNIDPDLVALMKQGKASVSIDGISVSDQAHTVDSYAACLVEESGRQEYREAHKDTLCPEDQEERSEV